MIFRQSSARLLDIRRELIHGFSIQDPLLLQQQLVSAQTLTHR